MVGEGGGEGRKHSSEAFKIWLFQLKSLFLGPIFVKSTTNLTN